jgi:hypothetical protein
MEKIKNNSCKYMNISEQMNDGQGGVFKIENNPQVAPTQRPGLECGQMGTSKANATA